MMTRRGFLTRLAGGVLALWASARQRFIGVTPAQAEAIAASNLTLFNPTADVASAFPVRSVAHHGLVHGSERPADFHPKA